MGKEVYLGPDLLEQPTQNATFFCNQLECSILRKNILCWWGLYERLQCHIGNEPWRRRFFLFAPRQKFCTNIFVIYNQIVCVQKNSQQCQTWPKMKRRSSNIKEFTFKLWTVCVCVTKFQINNLDFIQVLSHCIPFCTFSFINCAAGKWIVKDDAQTTYLLIHSVTI